jgi:hypothetical protein
MGEGPECRKGRGLIYRSVMVREQGNAWRNSIQEMRKSRGLDLDGGREGSE